MSNEDKEQVLAEVQHIVVNSLEDVDKILKDMEAKLDERLKKFELSHKI
jgi:hypothetical protein